MMKKIIIVYLLISMFFTSCVSGRNNELLMVGQDTIIYKEQDHVCNDDNVRKAVENKTKLQDFCKSFSLPYYKQIIDETYTVVRTEKARYLIIFDEEDKADLLHLITFSTVDSDVVAQIPVGTTFSEIMKLDPDGQYNFLYTSWSGAPQISYHFFESGKCFRLLYSNKELVQITPFTI